MKLLMCLLMCCSCLYLATSWIPIVLIEVCQINGTASPSTPDRAKQDLNIHYMNCCSHIGMYVQCLYNKAPHNHYRFKEEIWKTALMDTLSFMVPSRDVDSFVLGPIGASVAWYVALRSLPCHMGSSYLARLTGY